MKKHYFRCCNTIILYKIIADTLEQAERQMIQLGWRRDQFTPVTRRG